MPSDRPRATRQPAAFLWLYALAWAGGAVAYVPFLTILLPIRVAVMAGDQKVQWLAYITFFGAVAASIGGIVFGWLSDRSGTRRPWIVAGLLGTVLLMMCIPLASRPLELLLLIVVWQLALNMMLGPLSAWAADHVAPSQLGQLGGLLALSPALGSVAGALVTLPRLADADGRLAVVSLLVCCCVLPALIFAKPVGDGTGSHAERLVDNRARRAAAIAVGMWTARFLVQISEATLFAYLYYYFHTIDPSRDAGWIARLFGLVTCTAVPAALLVGRWSDRSNRPILPLIAAAFMASIALMTMAFAGTSDEAAVAYVLFGFATTIFLSLHSAQTLRVLSDSERRGRDLGYFNLTNTAPSLIIPWLTVAIVPTFGFAHLFLVLAAFALIAVLILSVVASRIHSNQS